MFPADSVRISDDKGHVSDEVGGKRKVQLKVGHVALLS